MFESLYSLLPEHAVNKKKKSNTVMAICFFIAWIVELINHLNFIWANPDSFYYLKLFFAPVIPIA